MPDTEIAPLARALGRIPCGLYVVTSVSNGRPLGFVASLLMQTGFRPPTLCVAVSPDRGALAAIRASGRFTVSILDHESRGAMGAFFGKSDPFLDLELAETGGPPALADALAWLSCRVRAEHEVGDHVVVFGEVEDGAPLRSGDPAVHLRKNGLGY
jgi:flavin reductase (DIM6/NTAB) family NADH-FMN oxidoreductase RutF